MKNLKRLEGQEIYDCQEEIFLDEETSVYPLIRLFDGYIDLETGFIRLFGSFEANDEEYYIVIYVDAWRSDNEAYAKPQDIETIQDSLRVEWLNVDYDVYIPNEKEAFLRLLESYETQEA
jgi:hypothetical protein